MPKYSDIFIKIMDQGIDPVPMTMLSKWSNEGNSIVHVESSGLVPENIELRTLLYPSGAGLSSATIQYLLDRDNTNILLGYVRNSGYYFNVQHFYDNLRKYKYDHVIAHDDQNDYYFLAYSASAIGETSIFQEVIAEVPGVVLTKPAVPNPNNISVEAQVLSENPEVSDIQLSLYHKREINNFWLSDPDPYKVYIWGKETNLYYEPDGTPIPSPGQATANNFFEDSLSGMFLTLPFVSGDIGSSKKRTYEISMTYYDQDGDQTPAITFDTDKINESSDLFDVGEIESFLDVKAEKVEEIPIKKDVVLKKRLAVGVEDLGIMNELYSKEGVYVSEYYNLDDPLYTFYMKAGETLPETDGYSIVRYYVQFNNQDWVRFSPVTRLNEVDDDGNFLPKFFVLDDLNIGHISTQLTELKYDFPVYSFRIRIEIDMSFMETNNFISPAIDYYECHVTDRNSFMRVE